MLVVKLNKSQFEYDIHSLVKAFYPEQDVKVFLQGEKDFLSSDNMPEIFVDFQDKQIDFQIKSKKLDRIFSKQQGKTIIAEKDESNSSDEDYRYPVIEDSMQLEEPDNRPVVKNQLKQLIYTTLSRYTGTILPWGTLTGIRPTKIAYGLLDQGKNEEETLQHLQDTYYISDEKGKLSIDIAKREKQILSPINYENGYSLYIGIPFCPTTCLYCSFTSYPIGLYQKKVAAYLQAMEKEIDYVKEAFQGKILDSVYIGGGTPTTLEPEELSWLLHKIKTSFDFSTVKEFTVEAGRADSITREKLETLYRYGVTRISVNPQTMKDETLKIIGRRHTVAQAKEAFLLAREVGFTNINMDLILGLPGENEEDVRHTIEEVVALAPDSLTVHSLAIKRASKLNQWIQTNGIETLHNTDSTMEIAASGAKKLGMEPYYLYRQKNMSGNLENVGYATEGKFGIYNILIMEEKQTIVAIGAGTITKRVDRDGRIERCDSIKDVDLYIEKIDEMIERKKKLFDLKNMSF
ncbi:MAG: coproporphyrinogen dehydrogenase HemZ [Eubacteriales bacterium]